MNIYMYNTWFGDCFEIKQNNRSLFVDFGIHQSCLNSAVSLFVEFYSKKNIDRDIVHNDICSDIEGRTKLPDLLITHYHIDHYSGLKYMMDNKRKTPAFGVVYIPDIWNFVDSKSIVAVHLLEELCKKAKLSGGTKSPSLFELIKYLCGHVSKVELIRRGKKFDSDRFTALWPDVKVVGAYAKNLISRNIIDKIGEVFEFSDRIIKIVNRMVANDGNNQKIKEQLIFEISNLINEYEQYNLPYDILDFLEEIKLNSFGNQVSIVFHNTKSGYDNILFTGDVTKGHMNRIYRNEDGVVAMHQTYKVIKIPHHGTKLYFFDYSKFKPKVLLFPNGKCKKVLSYKISDLYRPLNMKKDVSVYCSNSNWCEMNSTHDKIGCYACNGNIIFPKLKDKVY